MQTAVVAFGAVVIVVCLIGFVRSLWRPKRGTGNGGYGSIPGETPVDGSAHGPPGGDAGA